MERCDREWTEGACRFGRGRAFGAGSVRVEQMFMSLALPEPRAGAAAWAAPRRPSLRRLRRQPPNHALQPTPVCAYFAAHLIAPAWLSLGR